MLARLSASLPPSGTAPEAAVSPRIPRWRRKEETRIIRPPAASMVRTCVNDPAAQSVRAVACRSAQEGVGNAGCPRTRSRVRKVESTRVSHHGYAGNTRHSRTRWFTAYSALSPVTGLSCHCRRRKPVSANLMPASGHQDHTPSPSASGALVFCALRVHRIPPRVRDDRDTPLEWDETEQLLH